MRFVTILLIFLSLRVAAQTSVEKPASDRTYVYKISDAEAEEIFRIKSNEVSDNYFHSYLTSYQNSIRPNLEPGHYLFVTVENGSVRIKIESETDIIPFLLMRQGGPALILYNKKGELITNAVIETGEHKTGYNHQEKAYVFNDPKPGLKAYKIRWKGQVGYFQGSYYGEMDFKEPKRSKKLTRSYLVFNKPKYFPGDTVKFKAFFVKKGKPVNAEAEANLYADDWQPKPIAKLAELEVKDGAVWYEFPLSDTLQLDETYVIKVRNKGKRWTLIFFISILFFKSTYYWGFSFRNLLDFSKP